jgi:hypothetical protein
MNHSRFPTLAAAAAALAAPMGWAAKAEAVVVPIIQNSTLTGIDGLEADGVVYDVTFIPVPGNRPAPQFLAAGSALTASRVLGAELVKLSSEALPSSYRIFTAFGEPLQSGNVLPSEYEIVLLGNSVVTSFEVLGPLTIEPASNSTASEFFLPVLTGPPTFNGTGDYAVWTSVQTVVPEPSSLVLTGVGMAGVAAAAAVRRKKKPV